ncbi:MAG: hypothetical protein Kow0079_15930 [Vicingaceae bacterium]
MRTKVFTIITVLTISFISCLSKKKDAIKDNKFVTISQNSTDIDTYDNAENQKIKPVKPNYKIAIQFINDYIDFLNGLKSENSIVDWINNRNDVTVEFKNEFIKILEDAEKIDSELGLGFDPILDAQDYPKKFRLEKSESEYVIVKGENWPEFTLTLKMKFVEEKWCVDGAGIINIPKNKRMKR